MYIISKIQSTENKNDGPVQYIQDVTTDSYLGHPKLVFTEEREEACVLPNIQRAKYFINYYEKFHPGTYFTKEIM